MPQFQIEGEAEVFEYAEEIDNDEKEDAAILRPVQMFFWPWEDDEPEIA